MNELIIKNQEERRINILEEKYDIIIEENAKCSLALVAESLKNSKVTITAKDNSRLTLLLLVLNVSGNTTLNIKCEARRGAIIKQKALLVAKDEANIQLTFKNLLRAEAKNEYLNRAIVRDAARISNFGLLEIAKDAEKSEGRMEMKGYILSSDARVSMLPELSIKTNNVKAGHSASTSKLDPESLFYMQSRGINVLDAQKLFLEEALNFFLKNSEFTNLNKQDLLNFIYE